MTSIYEIASWSDVGSFLIWTLAVCALAKALFGSLPAAELQYRLSLRDTPRRQRITRLNWEVNNRTKWNGTGTRSPVHGTQAGLPGPGAQQAGSPHTAAIPLSDAELETKRRELQRLTRASFTRRAFTYFMACFACQTFWTAVAIYAITCGVTDPTGWFFSAAAYSGAAVLLSVFYGSGQNQPIAPTGRKPGCQNCGN